MSSGSLGAKIGQRRLDQFEVRVSVLRRATWQESKSIFQPKCYNTIETCGLERSLQSLAFLIVIQRAASQHALSSPGTEQSIWWFP